MKNWLNKISVLCLVSLALVSCEKDGEQVQVSVGDAPALTASATTVVLAEAQADDAALTMTWTPLNLKWSDATVSHNTAVKYTLQFDTEEDNFASPEVVEVGSSLEKTFTHGEMNALLNRMELESGKASKVVVRLFPHVGDNQTPVYSNPIAMSVTPWLDKPKFATVYMVGDATDNGWSNPGGTPMFRSESNPFLFTYTGYLKKGMLKFVQIDGQWAPQWGSDAAGTGVAFRATEQDPDPGVFNIPADGYYTANLNLRSMTFTLTPYNAAGAKTFTSIGIIGPFTDWSSIIPMTNSPFNPHYWSLEHTFAAPTQMKFRWNTNWDENWGPAEGKESGIYGLGLPQGAGKNIEVAAGTYRIIFNDLTGNYVLIKK